MTLIAITISSGLVQRSRYSPLEQLFPLLSLFFVIASSALMDYRPVDLKLAMIWNELIGQSLGATTHLWVYEYS